MKINLKFLTVTVMSLLLFACDDDKENVSPEISEEVSLLVTSSIASNSYGVHALIGQSTVFYNDAMDFTGGRQSVCDYTDSGESSVESPANSPISYAYSYSYDIAVNCSSIQVPTSLSVDFTYAGAFDGPRLTWEHEGTGEFEISLNASQQLVYNGVFGRSGQYSIKDRENISGNSTVQLMLSNVSVDPETEDIVSGGGTYNIVITRNERVYTFSGTVTFNGDGTATLGINGSEVTFDLITAAAG